MKFKKMYIGFLMRNPEDGKYVVECQLTLTSQLLYQQLEIKEEQGLIVQLSNGKEYVTVRKLKKGSVNLGVKVLVEVVSWRN